MSDFWKQRRRSRALARRLAYELRAGSVTPTGVKLAISGDVYRAPDGLLVGETVWLRARQAAAVEIANLKRNLGGFHG